LIWWVAAGCVKPRARAAADSEPVLRMVISMVKCCQPIFI
jgi:hypothetical protein